MAKEEARRRRKMFANNEITTTTDSTLTLIETVSNKLEVARFDYRGLEDLKLELNLMQDLLRRAGFLSRSQSLVLFPFFERLRHFYFLLRKEREFVYIMVAEIAKFCDIIAGFRIEFCEWNTSLLDAVFDKLMAMVYPDDDSGEWRKLKLELKLVKMLYQLAVNRRDMEGNGFFLSDIKPGVDENAKQLYYCLVRLEASGKVVNLGLAESLASFRESLSTCFANAKLWVRDLYNRVSNSLLMSYGYPWPCSELIAFFDSLLKCLVWGQRYDPKMKQFIDPIVKMMCFLMNYVRFSTFLVDKPHLFATFLLSCQVSVIRAACLGYMYWFCRDDHQVSYELQLKGSEFVDAIKPGNVQATESYITTLMDSRDSKLSLFFFDMGVVTNFVNSLSDNLSEFSVTNTSGMASVENQMGRLAEKLELFRTMLRKQEEKPWLNQDGKDVVIDSVYEAGIILLQFHLLKKEKGLSKELNSRISKLEEKVFPLRAKLNPKISLISGAQDAHILEDDMFIGYDAQPEDIKNKLLSGSTDLKFVAIVGAGATTLANEVYHDSAVVSHFDIRAWCNVSQASTMDNILLEILRCIDPSTSMKDQLDCLGSLAEVVHQHLKNRRYLVVLDDIWGNEVLNLLESSFPRQGVRSRVVLTSVEKIHQVIKYALVIYLLQHPVTKYLILMKHKMAHSTQVRRSLSIIAKLSRVLHLVFICWYLYSKISKQFSVPY